MIFGETTTDFANARRPIRRPSRVALAVRWILCSLIQLYRFTLSPAQTFLFGPHCGCRFTPTCSRYAMDAIREHGALAGSVLALKRICRCHPFGTCGHDPVPAASPPEKHPYTC